MEDKLEKNTKIEKEDKRKEKLTELHKSNLLLIVFGISFILYLLTKSIIFAFLSGFSLIAYFFVDIYVSASQTSWKQEIIEILKAAALAIIIFATISFLLGTSVPISSVVSCSLLPSYERGDFVIVQGIKAKDINAPTIEITEEELNDINNSKVLCGSSKNGSIIYKCQSMCPRISSSAKKLVGYSPECVRSIYIDEKEISENLTNDVIVYASHLNGTYTNMDIVHRVFLKLKVGESYYLLTKGDNNNYMDISYFDIVRESDIKGKVIFRIPILGYVKLVISGPAYYGEPEGCDTILLH
ncbi:MAG: S26 family signal peptidase [Candidatus Micrarchaeia archaeon]